MCETEDVEKRHGRTDGWTDRQTDGQTRSVLISPTFPTKGRGIKISEQKQFFLIFLSKIRFRTLVFRPTSQWRKSKIRVPSTSLHYWLSLKKNGTLAPLVFDIGV